MGEVRKLRQRARIMSDDPVVAALEALGERIDSALSEPAPAPAPPVSGVVVPVWIAGIVVSMLLGSLATSFGAIVAMNTRLTVVENSYLSVPAAEQMRRDIEANIPPLEVQRRLTDHERRLDRIEGN